MNKNARDLVLKINEFKKSLSNSTKLKRKRESSIEEFEDNILPFDLYRGKRNNITKIGDQINKAFNYEIFDGCAVLMRRLIEMLLILTFKENGIENEIKDNSGNYLQLSELIRITRSTNKINLTRNAKEYLDLFKDKGNLSAHNPFHNARRKDLEVLQPKFRHLVEELFYKSGILK